MLASWQRVQHDFAMVTFPYLHPWFLIPKHPMLYQKKNAKVDHMNHENFWVLIESFALPMIPLQRHKW
jgi:hypothetical protein